MHSTVGIKFGKSGLKERKKLAYFNILFERRQISACKKMAILTLLTELMMRVKSSKVYSHLGEP